MNIKRLLTGLAFAIALVSNAQAVTLTAGKSFELKGGILSTTALSYFTINNDGTLSAHIVESSGNIIDILNLSFSSKMGEINMYDPVAGVKVYQNQYKDIGEYTTTTGAVFDVATAYPVKIYDTSNLFKTWVVIANKTTGGLQIGQRDFHLTIGNDVSAQVPEPMSMSLLGLGLLGGAYRRKKAAL